MVKGRSGGVMEWTVHRAGGELNRSRNSQCRSEVIEAPEGADGEATGTAQKPRKLRRLAGFRAGRRGFRCSQARESLCTELRVGSGGTIGKAPAEGGMDSRRQLSAIDEVCGSLDKTVKSVIAELKQSKERA